MFTLALNVTFEGERRISEVRNLDNGGGQSRRSAVMKALAAEMLSSVFDFERCAKFTSLVVTRQKSDYNALIVFLRDFFFSPFCEINFHAN